MPQNIRPYSNYADYKTRHENALPQWATRFEKGMRPGPRRTDYLDRLGYRTEFQMDRDDILYSPSFRQLAYKRQMFSSRRVQSFYTRLTHTLIVSQIARSIGRGLQLDEHLVEAIALGHDLGHAPYGHSGEDGINRFLDKILFPRLHRKVGPEAIGDLPLQERVQAELQLRPKRTKKSATVTDRQKSFLFAVPPSLDHLEQNFYCLPNDKKIFDHHRQSYRLLRILEKGGRGLGLTLLTYYGILRASMATNDNDGFHLRFEDIDTLQASYEAQVVRLADDIAWANHDLTEDLRKRGSDPKELLDRFCDESGVESLHTHYDELNQLLHAVPGERYGKFITDAIEFNKGYLESVEPVDHGSGLDHSIGLSDEMTNSLMDMKQIVRRTVHESTSMQNVTKQSVEQVERICDVLVEGSNFESYINPVLYRGRPPTDLSTLEKARAIADYVSFLTDAEADSLYQKHYGVFVAEAVPQQLPSRESWPLR